MKGINPFLRKKKTKSVKKGSQFICLSVILIDSVFKTGKNYYSQVFLEECKYVNEEDSDKDNSNEEN